MRAARGAGRVARRRKEDDAQHVVIAVDLVAMTLFSSTITPHSTARRL